MEKKKNDFYAEVTQEEADRAAREDQQRRDLLHNLLQGPPSGGKRGRHFFVARPC